MSIIKKKIEDLYLLEDKIEIEKILFEDFCNELDKLLDSNEPYDILKGINLINDIIKYLGDKNLIDLYGVFGSIYLLDEKYIEIFYKAKNNMLLYNLELFYSDRGFFDKYVTTLKEMRNIITRNNLIEMIILSFDDISYEVIKYIQYLRDNKSYLEIVEDEILEYGIFREIFIQYIKKYIKDMDKNKVEEILEFFEKMSYSPDKRVITLLIDMVIELEYLEVDWIIQLFGDNFLKLYANYFDGNIFEKKEKLWKEVERRNLEI